MKIQLTAGLDHLRQTARKSKNFASEVARAAAEAIEQLDQAKQDKLTCPVKVPGTAGGTADLIVGRDDMASGVGFKQSAADCLMLARTDSDGRISGNARMQIAAPADSSDAATKGYVDGLVGGIASLLDAINGEVV